MVIRVEALLLALTLSTLTGIAAVDDAAVTEQHDYCIVGAGPAGIQLGHFFKHAGRDYVVFESKARAGSFFEKYPRHRKLISLNKRFVREGRGTEFAFRHDWNSLIDVRRLEKRTPPVTTRSKELFPHADVVAHYLAEFAEEQADAIRYSVEVTRILRDSAGGSDNKSFVLRLHPIHADGDYSVHCREVVVASGLPRPVSSALAVDGEQYVEGYESMASTGEGYEGKSVLVLGLGNAALETAQELQKHTSELHVFGRGRQLPDGGKGVRMAYMTHYVGDIRAGRTTILDTYLLKSLDTFDSSALDGGDRIMIIPCKRRLCVFGFGSEDCADERCQAEFSKGGQNLSVSLPIGTWVKGSKMARRVRKLLAKHVPKRRHEVGESSYEISDSELIRDDEIHAFERDREKDEWFASSDGRFIEDDEKHDRVPVAPVSKRKKLGIVNEDFSQTEYEELVVNSDLLRGYPDLADALADIRAITSNLPLRYPMDSVVRCFGWVMEKGIFDASVPLQTVKSGKYPAIDAKYEALGVPGLYFAGTLAHSLDFRKSAGGFIHGFRYTARALFHLLEEKNHGVHWPETVLPLTAAANAGRPTNSVDSLVRMLIARINNCSGPYQMFGAMGDMVIFERTSVIGHWVARYLYEVPLKLFLERYVHLPRIVWTFRYGDDFHGPKVLGPDRVGSTNPYTAEESNFLHPYIRYFDAGTTEPSHHHFLVEDIFTMWGVTNSVPSLARFIARVVSKATGEDAFMEPGAFREEHYEDDLDDDEVSICDGMTPSVNAFGRCGAEATV